MPTCIYRRCAYSSVLKVLAVVDAFNIFTLRVADDHDVKPLLSMQVGKQRKHDFWCVTHALTLPAVGLETADSKRDTHH